MRRPAVLALALVVCACTAAPTGTPPPADGPGVEESAGHGDGSGDPVEGSAAHPPVDGAVPPPLHPRVDRLPATTVRINPVGGGTVTVAVRVAAASDARRQGLMGVRELPDGAGMLFVFDEARRGGFWMRDTLVPLDIAFVGADGRIDAILTMEPCVADPCPVYDPAVAYRWALEVPAGWFARNGVQPRDPVVWDPPGAAAGQ